MATESQQVFSDGAGGERHVPAKVRQAGAGGAAVKLEQDQEGRWRLHDLAFFAHSIPGTQTVPRAELIAATSAAGLSSTSQAALGIDATYVTNGLTANEKQRWRRTSSSNGDLWEQFYSTAGSRTAQKVPAHTIAAQVAAGEVDAQIYIGNGIADAVAGIAAQLCQPTSLHQQWADEQQSLAYHIALRIGAVDAAHLEALPQQVSAPVLPDIALAPSFTDTFAELTQAVANTGHSLHKAGHRLRCWHCLENYTKKQLGDRTLPPCPAKQATKPHNNSNTPEQKGPTIEADIGTERQVHRMSEEPQSPEAAGHHFDKPEACDYLEDDDPFACDEELQMPPPEQLEQDEDPEDAEGQAIP